MEKDNLNNKLENDLDVFKEIFIVLKLANKYYSILCQKYNITEMQFEVLYLLHISRDNGLKISKLGNKLEMARSGVTLLVDKMALAGLAKRCADAEDRRIIKVMITEKGNEIMKEIFPSNEIFKVSSLDFMKQDEKELLCKLIIKTKEELVSKVSMIYKLSRMSNNY